MSKLEDFNNDISVAAEYSDEKTCDKSDVGYHCSCYDYGQSCCICGKTIFPLAYEQEGFNK